MKKVLCTLILSVILLSAFSQHLQVKKQNFTTFNKNEKVVSDLLNKQSSAAAQKHPEYGILPFNVQCRECIELIDKRTETTRFFVDPKNVNHSYSQQSYFPLHYRLDTNDIWRTVDPRLKPDANNPGVYSAPDQLIPTQCDLNRKLTTIDMGELKFEFNKGLSMYFFDDNLAYTAKSEGNYNVRTIGEDGLLVKNMWPGIDMQQIFRAGEVETEYVINAPLDLPINGGWMVIEDHFSLPDGFTFEETPRGEHTAQGFYRGDYVIKDKAGEPFLDYRKPVFFDAMAFGQHGDYKLLKEDNNYTLQLYVPVSWLKRAENVYPIYIDPIINPDNFATHSKLGDFTSAPHGVMANMGFTTMNLGSCNYHMSVSVPRATKISNAYVDIEYTLTYDNTCGTPPEPAPYCTFSQATMEVQCDTCNTTTGTLSCRPGHPPYTGTCTTDSVLSPGPPAAHSILINDFVPNYLSCIPAVCDTSFVNFTLKNRDSICGDVCGELCARGNIWQMTLEAKAVMGTITADKTNICAGQPVTLTAHPTGGVLPYHYIWYNGNTTDTIYGSDNYVIHPQQDVSNLYCYVLDTCNRYYWPSNMVNITVGAAPPADAGPDDTICGSGTITLGGSPTTSGATVQWTASSATALGWLNSTTSLNPKATIPAGNTGNYFYVVTATNPSCFRQDTAFVTVDGVPSPVVDSSGPIDFCDGNSVMLSVTSSYSQYNWSNGKTTQSITVSTSGQYTVTVTDANGCTGSGASSIPVVVKPAPPANGGPDIHLCEGGAATLGSNPTTSGNNVSILWTGSDPTVQGWLNDDTTANPQLTVPAGTIQDFYYVLMTSDPNCSRLDTVHVFSKAYPQPVIDSSGPTQFCNGQNVILSTVLTYTAYNWSNQATTQSIKVTQTGQYQVTVTDANGCTGASNTIPVTIISIPPFQVFPDTTIMYGDSIMLTTNADLSSNSVDSFNWYPNINISCLTCANPQVSPVADRYYGLTLYLGGCNASDSALIKVIYPNNFFVPNAFTPNGDGTNDNFYVEAQAGVHVSLFQVFDRLGEKVHEGNYAWDGNYKGKPAPAGVYTYLFKIELFGDQRPVFRRGSVTLIR